MKYQTLTTGDTVQQGDEFRWNRSSPWQAADEIGARLVGGHCEFRRPIKDNWIALSDRKPTKKDAHEGKVLAMTFDGRLCFQSLPADVFSDSVTHWMPTNFVPREPARIKVDGHEVIPQKNGDLKVGCQTISSKDFEEIARQRQEAMK